MKLIVAIDKNNGIGKDNSIPWYIKEELKYFKHITTHTTRILDKNIVIMGRNTWESIPDKYKPLADRINIIITTNQSYTTGNYDHTYIQHSLDKALTFIQDLHYINLDNIFIIGGERLYKEAINRTDCEKLYVTEVYGKYECDRFFPSITDNYKLATVSKFKCENDIYYRNMIYYNIDHIKYKLNPDSESCLWKNNEEYQYINCLYKIFSEGRINIDRTGIGTRSIFGETFKYDLSDTFPVLTTKRQFLRGIFEEFMFYLSGKTDNGILQDKRIHIWDGNTSRQFLDARGLTDYPENDMGETYGFNFRHYGATYKTCKENYTGHGFDQLNYVINLIKTNPTSRRIIIDIWNGSTIHKAALPPCLCKYQFYVDTANNKLDLMLYIRSSDFFLANNWNTCTGAFFVHMICALKGIDLTPGILTVITGDTHIYSSHIEQVTTNLIRVPKPFPKLVVKCKKDNIEDFVFDDMNIIGYYPSPNIAASMAI
jgi:dihydrofolate reductase / thymidylate synthase